MSRRTPFLTGVLVDSRLTTNNAGLWSYLCFKFKAPVDITVRRARRGPFGGLQAARALTYPRASDCVWGRRVTACITLMVFDTGLLALSSLLQPQIEDESSALSPFLPPPSPRFCLLYVYLIIRALYW